MPISNLDYQANIYRDARITNLEKPPVVTLITAAGAGNYDPRINDPRYVIAEWVGGGGAGGGAAATGAAESSEGGGGGGGEWAYTILTRPVGGWTGTIAYSIGAGGTAGAAGNNPGNAGGSTTFNGITANGGAGGAGGANTAGSNSAAGGVGGTAGAGTALLRVPGSDGGNSRVITALRSLQSHGGASGRGLGSLAAASINSGNGVAGKLYGGGGSGAGNGNSQVARTGGPGANGALILTECF